MFATAFNQILDFLKKEPAGLISDVDDLFEQSLRIIPAFRGISPNTVMGMCMV